MHAWWERLVAVFLPPQVEPFITALWRVNKTMIKTVMLWLVGCFSAAAVGQGDEKFIRRGPPVLCAQGLFASCAGHLRHAVSGSKSLLLEQEARGERGHGAKQGLCSALTPGRGEGAPNGTASQRQAAFGQWVPGVQSWGTSFGLGFSLSCLAGQTDLHVQCDVPQRLLLGHAEEQCMLDVRNVFF